MSDIEWDADDYEPAAAVPKSTEKWEGEDEDDDVKANWDDEDKEEDPASSENKAVQVKKKKALKDRLAEKEAQKEEQRKKMEEAARLAKEAQTPEGQAAARLRIQKEQEESDLKMAMLTFGEAPAGDGELDRLVPQTIEEFEKYETLLKERITRSDKSIHYVGFLENLFRDLCLGVESEDIKKLASALNVLANEKSKQQKPAKSKKKAKAKASLSAGKDNTLEDYVVDYSYDDFI